MHKVMTRLAIGAMMMAAISAHAANENWKQKFQKVSDEYFDQVYFHYSPTNGTLAGYHQYDAQLENYSRKSIDAEIASLRDFEKRIEAKNGGSSVSSKDRRARFAEGVDAHYCPFLGE